MSERLTPLEQRSAELQEMLERERDIELLGKLLIDRFPISSEELNSQHIDLVTPDGKELLVEGMIVPANGLPNTHVGARPYYYHVIRKGLAEPHALAVSPDGKIERPIYSTFGIRIKRDGSSSTMSTYGGTTRNDIYELYNDLSAARVAQVD